MVERLLPIDTAAAVLAGLLNGALQSVVLACLTLVAMRLLTGSGPGVRHLAWLTAMVSMLGLHIAATVDSFATTRAASALPGMRTASRASDGLHPTITDAAASVDSAPLLVELPASPWFPAILTAILLIAAARLLLVFRGLRHWRLLRARSKPLPEHLTDILANVTAESGRRAPVARLSAEIVCPVTMGYRRPTILLPPSLLTDLNPLELRQILAHEVAHVRRLDDWTNLAQRIIESVLFFNPLVGWTGRQMEMERELACDRQVLAVVGERKAYASCLLRLAATGRFPASNLVTGAAASRLGERVETLLHAPVSSSRPRSSLALAAVAPAVLFLVAVGLGPLPLRVAIAVPDPSMGTFFRAAGIETPSSRADHDFATSLFLENSFVVRLEGNGTANERTPDVAAGDAFSSRNGGSLAESGQPGWEVARVDYTPAVTAHPCGSPGTAGCGNPSLAVPDQMIRTVAPRIRAAPATVTSSVTMRRRGLDVVASGSGRAPTIGTPGDMYEEPRKTGLRTSQGSSTGPMSEGEAIINDLSPVPILRPSSVVRLR